MPDTHLGSPRLKADPKPSTNSRAAVQHGAMEFTTPPTNLDAVRLYRLGRLRAEMQERDYGALLLFDQLNTRYATDATNMQVWCSHFETRCVFIASEGPVVLFDHDFQPYMAEGLPTVDEYRPMPAFYYFAAGVNAGDKAREFGAEIADLIAAHCGGNRRIAIDRLSHLGIDTLRAHRLEVFDGQAVTEHARAVKSDGELVLMRYAMKVCDTGVQAMREALRPGITENELWSHLHRVNIAQGGEWIETRLLSSGPRTNPWFRECSMRPIEDGDLVCFDTDLIGPYGYCCDISRAWVCGDRPSDEQRRLYVNAFAQVEHNIGIVKPGMSFRELTAASWDIPEEYLANRYSCLCHGVGLADEYPSVALKPDLGTTYDGVIEAGMVLSFESYIGAEAGREGVKLEDQVVVTETGIERLSASPFETGYL